MGTLFDQPVRNHRRVELKELETQIQCLQVIANKCGVTFDQALATYKLLEYQRKTEVTIDNNDIWDEQIGGIGELLKELNAIISDAILKEE